MVTVAEIAKQAFDDVAAEITGITYTATLKYNIPGGYNATTGTRELIPKTITGGRAIFGTTTAIASKFPAYTSGPDDLLIMLEGFTTVPKVGWKLTLVHPITLASTDHTINAVGDIAGAGSFFEVVAA